jgi:hypothetical protein
MTKRRHVMKLFAVAVLASASGCETATEAAQPAARTTATTAPPPTPVPTQAPVTTPAVAPVGKQRVRTLPNGRPACGNVATKSPQPPDCVP